MSSTQKTSEYQTSIFYIGGVQIEPMLRRITTADGKATEVSQRQLAAIVELAETYDAIVPRAKMHEILCLTQEGMRDRGALSQHIGIIRRAFGDSSKNATFIKTVRGQGYYLLQEPSFTAPALDIEEPLAYQEPSATQEPSARQEHLAHQEPSAHKEPLSHKESFNDPTEDQSRSLVPMFWSRLVEQPARRAIIAVALFAIIGIGLGQLLNLKEPGKNTQQVLLTNQATINSADLNSGPIKNPTPLSESTITGNLDKPEVAALKQRFHDLLLDDSLSGDAKIFGLLSVADALMCLQDWDTSARAFSASLSLQRQLHAESRPLELAHTLTRLAQVKSVAAQSINGSRELLLEATRLIRDHQPNSYVQAQLLSTHAALLEFDNDLTGAKSLLDEALRIANAQPRHDSRFIGQLRIRLAQVLTHQADFESAESLTQMVLQASQSSPGEQLSLVPALSQYGLLLASQGKHEQAADKYAQVLSILVRHAPGEYSYLVQTKLGLAESLIHVGDADQAIALYTDVIKQTSGSGRSDPIKLSNLKLGLSNALIKAQKPDQAYQQIQHAMSLMENQNNVPDWLRYSANSLHGAALIELGNCDRGMQLLNNTIDEMFLDRVTDPRVSSKIHARKSYYETSRCLA